MEQVVSTFPQIEPLADSSEKKLDVWIGTLGFEDRCYAVAEALANGGAQSDHVFLCKYDTNPDDNEKNEADLLAQSERFGPKPEWFGADRPNLAERLRRRLLELSEASDRPLRIGWDVSVASNQVIVTVSSVLLSIECEVEVQYAEAATYYPTEEEYRADLERWKGEDRMGLDRGTLTVRVSSEHPGDHSTQLANRLFIIPGYNRDRVRRIISNVDSQFLIDLPSAPITWLIGAPRLPEDAWRQGALVEIHDVPGSHESAEIGTFDYRDTLLGIERTYSKWGLTSNITLAPMGSKMQAVGCALFCVSRPDVRVMFAEPEEYNAARYTKGVRNLWSLPLGSTGKLVDGLKKVGTLIRPELPQ